MTEPTTGDVVLSDRYQINIKRVYVVQGHTGEYSDSREWMVCAYCDEALAEEHARLANADAERWEAEPDYEKYPGGPAGGWSRYDPDMDVSYNGTHYNVVEVEVRESLP